MAAGCIACIIHFYLLGKPTAVASSIMSLLRSVLSLYTRAMPVERKQPEHEATRLSAGSMRVDKNQQSVSVGNIYTRLCIPAAPAAPAFVNTCFDESFLGDNIAGTLIAPCVVVIPTKEVHCHVF